MARAVHNEAQQPRTAVQELIIARDVEKALLLTGEGGIRQILGSRRRAYGDRRRTQSVVGPQHSSRDLGAGSCDLVNSAAMADAT